MASASPMNATRERILAAAAHLLSRRGIAGTRLADIAAHAQLRTPAVYYYFRSRDELVAEVMREGQRRVRAHVEQAIARLPADASVIESIDAAVEAHLRIELELSDFASAVTRNAGQLPPGMVDSLRLESAAYHAIWRTLLEQLADSGDLRPGLDLGVARMLIVGALNWTAEWWNPEQDSLENLISTTQSLVRNSLSTTDTAARPALRHTLLGPNRSTVYKF